MTTNQAKVKLSQWDAITLETLRVHGWPANELISRVKAGELPKDETKFQVKYEELTKLANEQPELFEQAVKEGYQIKFSTLRGTQSWVLLALQIEGQLVLEPGQEAVVIALTEEEKAKVEQTLSFGWHVVDHEGVETADGKKAYRIEPITRGV